MMIKQIALPSPAHMQDEIEGLTQRRDAEAARKVHPRGNGAHRPKRDVAAELAQAQTRLIQAETELNAALEDEYQIIAQYPFETGEGINLILYKPDQ
ncbi:MAG TPA: hypothetical protein VEF04_21210 [Blastocatellia bacterium]|nr:hypothetical protein [Blastocatellia bacterium]